MKQEFSISIAQDLFSSSNPFPVDFDIAWKWLDYSKKSDAKRALLKAGFIADIDMRITAQSDNHSTLRLSPQEKAALTRKEKISLTVECFKMWAMMAGTQRGREVRLYFLECERIAKSNQRIAAKSIPDYLPTRRECMDQLSSHGAEKRTYASVERYNNDLNGLPSGSRHSVTRQQADGLIINYLSATVELLKREKGFANHQNHLANTAKKAMRDRKVERFGSDSVPDRLKPKKERKYLESEV